jgi:hypothetical protein
MSGYTVKELKKIIMNYKKSNCPAVSRARRDELLMMVKDLNINVDEREPLERKKKEPKKERPKMRLPKADKIDLSQFENMVEFPKNKKRKTRLPKVDKIDLKKFESMGVEDLDKFELIGGDDLIGYTGSSSKFLENIKKLYPYGYQNLKLALEALRKQNKKDKTFLNIDDYFEKELKKPVFFNKEFFKNFVKKEGEPFSKTILILLFKLINKKFSTRDIDIPSEHRGKQGMVSSRISK